jgi:hypothetical protein
LFVGDEGGESCLHPLSFHSVKKDLGSFPLQISQVLK